jgi:hypothetical protein
LSHFFCHYSENENRWLPTPNGVEFDTDRLEPFAEYEKRQISQRNNDGAITFTQGETNEQTKEKILGRKNKKHQ